MPASRLLTQITVASLRPSVCLTLGVRRRDLYQRRALAALALSICCINAAAVAAAAAAAPPPPSAAAAALGARPRAPSTSSRLPLPPFAALRYVRTESAKIFTPSSTTSPTRTSRAPVSATKPIRERRNRDSVVTWPNSKLCKKTAKHNNKNR